MSAAATDRLLYECADLAADMASERSVWISAQRAEDRLVRALIDLLRPEEHDVQVFVMTRLSLHAAHRRTIREALGLQPFGAP